MGRLGNNATLIITARNKQVFKKILLLIGTLSAVHILFFYVPDKLSEVADNSSSLVEGDSRTHFPEELGPNSLELLQPSNNGPIRSKNRSDRAKKVLVWNAYWGSTAMWHKIFYEIIYNQCPQSNCIMTVDKTELGSADAVLFHLVDIVKENYSFPLERRPGQVWIGMTYEPPYILSYSKLNFTILNGLFNRTMSYRSDSDVMVRHGAFFEISDTTQFPEYLSDWVGSHKGISEKNYADGKRRLVSWFVSSRNCQSQSHREQYVEELQKHIPVDVYGACGPFKCGAQKTMRYPYKVEHDDCYLLISVAYKFVLAFENSICDDYVTEKLYNHLKLNVVPVVYGGANYSRFAPPKSYIDASQYSPKELAEYLQLLDRNDTLYNEYFEWKQTYYVEAHDGVPMACDLCAKLHNSNWLNERKVYDRFDAWMEQGCRAGWHPRRQDEDNNTKNLPE